MFFFLTLPVFAAHAAEGETLPPEDQEEILAESSGKEGDEAALAGDADILAQIEREIAREKGTAVFSEGTNAPQADSLGDLSGEGGGGEDAGLFSGGATQLIEESAKAPVYVFKDHLPEAQAFVSRKILPVRVTDRVKIEKVVAKWEGTRFLFPAREKKVPIELARGKFDGEEQDGIRFFPIAGALSVLRFPSIPPASRMVIYYGIEDDGVRAFAGKRISVYLSIYAGEKKIHRIHVPGQTGWFKETISLGLLAYMVRPVEVSFEVNSDDTERIPFYFNAEIYS
ncbi:MAG: hypothetical protein ACOY3K_07655 [Candidatus Omnitrophota bacterium]